MVCADGGWWRFSGLMGLTVKRSWAGCLELPSLFFFFWFVYYTAIFVQQLGWYIRGFILFVWFSVSHTHCRSIEQSINQSTFHSFIKTLGSRFYTTYFPVPISSKPSKLHDYFYQTTYRKCTPSALSSSPPSSSSPPQRPNTAPTSPQAPATYPTTQPALEPPTPSALAPVTIPTPQAVAGPVRSLSPPSILADHSSQQPRARFLRL